MKIIAFALLILMQLPNICLAESEAILQGFFLDKNSKEVEIAAGNSGCTEKNDFIFKVTEKTITVTRKKPDACKAMPTVTKFRYSFNEIGVKEFQTYRITNRFFEDPGADTSIHIPLDNEYVTSSFKSFGAIPDKKIQLGHVVVALTSEVSNISLGGYSSCGIYEANEFYPAIFTAVYSCSLLEDCETWKKDNCGKIENEN